MKKGILTLVLALIIVFINVNLLPRAQAHPGRTDSEGGHYCYTNCDTYGEEYDEWHCHDDCYVAPPEEPWYCEINGVKYYSHAQAEKAWYAPIDTAVADIYKKLLKRESNENDHKYWHSKIPYNNCDVRGWNGVEIWDEVMASEEYKNLTPDPTIPPTPPTKIEETKEENSGTSSWLWLLAIYPAAGIYGWWKDRK